MPRRRSRTVRIHPPVYGATTFEGLSRQRGPCGPASSCGGSAVLSGALPAMELLGQAAHPPEGI